ncbi:uncharacterized protein LOC124128891 isoform X3 [Haliotis rufescens]|uniref:uncharacterized protein LOC124128891 isoform X3 n=1 Tax=Haliotis rufescens TaxID=6454 RepID=UPI00201F3F45|nr:uncharacterized protein LOC124128891 isoform X3 [Haliotis rufescens]
MKQPKHHLKDGPPPPSVEKGKIGGRSQRKFSYTGFFFQLRTDNASHDSAVGGVSRCLGVEDRCRFIFSAISSSSSSIRTCKTGTDWSCRTGTVWTCRTGTVWSSKSSTIQRHCQRCDVIDLRDSAIRCGRGHR